MTKVGNWTFLKTAHMPRSLLQQSVYKKCKQSEVMCINATLFTYSTHKTNSLATLYDELSFSKPAD